MKKSNLHLVNFILHWSISQTLKKHFSDDSWHEIWGKFKVQILGELSHRLEHPVGIPWPPPHSKLPYWEDIFLLTITVVHYSL